MFGASIVALWGCLAQSVRLDMLLIQSIDGASTGVLKFNRVARLQLYSQQKQTRTTTLLNSTCLLCTVDFLVYKCILFQNE